MTLKNRNFNNVAGVLALVIICLFAFSSCFHEHTFGEWSYAVLPTCTEAGVQSRMCTGCDLTEEMPAEPLGHDEVQHAAVAATCTEKGNEAYVTCSRCDYTTFKETEALGHKEVQCKGKDATCTEKGYEPYVFCERCEYRTFKEIPALGHDEVQHERKQSTCLEKGWTAYVTCSRCDYTTFKELPLSGHQQAVLAAKQPTCTETGLTVGSYCKLCHITIKAQTVVAAKGHSCKQGICTVCGAEDYIAPDQYASKHMYNGLATYPNGKNMQELYNRMTKAAKEFHLDYSINLTPDDDNYIYLPGFIDCRGLSISRDEAKAVCAAFITDNPIYYWMGYPHYSSSSSNKNSITAVWITVYNGYEKGSTREYYNKRLAAAVKVYTDKVKGEKSAYQTALCYYEQVIINTSYSYTAAGDAKTYPWASNVIGTFCMNQAICGGYSKAFQLLMNFSEIECRTVIGYTEDAYHMWNAAKMDDGNWYWFDITWDDEPYMPFEFETRYFCISDTQYCNWKDISAPGVTASMGNKRFLQTHTPNPVGDDEYSAFHWSYFLPQISSHKFQSDSTVEIREIFEVNGAAYALVGYRQVQLVRLSSSSAVFAIPETVSYNGVEYTVVSVGAIMTSGLFDGSRPVGNGYAKSVILPKTVKYVMPRSVTSENNAVNIFYEGTASKWKAVTIASKYTAKSKIYYYSETRPNASGNYWHYVDGVPTPW